MPNYRLFKLLFIAVLFLTQFSFAQPAGYGFGKQLLIDETQVAGATDLTDFVMLVSFTDTDLRTVANGGNVANSNGFDIVFTLGDCSTLLDHQIEEYNPVTGELIAWVKVPTIFANVDTGIHMYYGNAGVAADPSTTAVWDADYAAVWHMNQSPAGTAPQLIDYTANTNDGTANGTMTAGDLVTGKIGDGIDFDGSNDFFDCGADASSDPQLDITVSAWINSRAASGHIINRGGGWDDPGYSLFHLSNNIRIELQRAGEKDIVDNAISINVWHYVALTYDNSTGTIRCFIDGVQQATTGTHTGPMGLPVENLNIARKEQNAFYFNGVIDEGRVIHVNRNADWLLTEYNNQNAPNTFYSKSAQFTAGDLCTLLPIELIHFSAEIVNDNNCRIQWITASEINNAYFTVETSTNGTDWEMVGQVDGAGNSSNQLHYSLMDYKLFNPVTYYRLKQTDFDGQSVTSKVISVQLELATFVVYPNPTAGQVNVLNNVNDVLVIYNSLGQVVYQTQLDNSKTVKTVNLSELPNGIYLVKTSTGIQRIVKK